MAWLAARRGVSCAAALGLAFLVALCGCSAVADYVSGAAAIAPTVALDVTATPEQAAPVTATPCASAPSMTTTAAPATAATAIAAPTPAVVSDAADEPGLLFARDMRVLQAGYLGGEAREVAVVPPYDAWALADGRLALALGPAVEVLDLLGGGQTSLRVEADGEIEFAEVLWGASGETLLHAAVVADGGAPAFGRRVELRALRADDGRELGTIVVPDVAGVTALRYDEAVGTVSFIPRGDDPALGELRVAAFPDGLPATALDVEGDGEAVLSPDGSHLATTASADGAALLIHDLDGGIRRWPCPTGTYAASPVWSPDGRTVAFLLLPKGGDPEGGESATNTDDIGVWLLEDVVVDGELQARLVMAEPGGASSLAGWTPDGGHVVGYHRGDADDAYAFAVRPDGGDRRILNLGADAEILGWMPRVSAEAVALAVDPWPARFAQAQQDASALAAVVAEYVAAHADQPDEVLSTALGERLTAAGLQPDLAGPQVRHIDEGLYIAQFPPQQICLLEGGRAQPVASGDLITDARREGDALGLIYGMIGASAVQPGFVLLAAQDDGSWAPRWSPQGQRDWIATDGEIRFEGEGLGTLRVSGTSFGIDLGEADPFVECHACLHRELQATWVRDGEGYTRRSALPADAALPQVIWEMTVPAPYAVLHEALRRARAGEDVGDLATTDALAQLDALGLMTPGVRLLPEDVDAEPGSSPLGDDVVLFGGEGGARYRATVREGRLVEVTAEND
jgi:hypothetical protein